MHLIPLPALSDNYIWLLADAQGNALVIDPGEAAPVQAYLEREGLTLRAILLTHHHPDHIGGAATLREHHGAEIHAPRDERIPLADHRVAEGDRVTLDTPACRFTVIEVPGHTRSHVAYAGEGLLFCGDTLFSLGCGRMFEGTPEQMLASLERLAALPDDTRVCCGHEYTRDNGAFAHGIEPDNGALASRRKEVEARHARGEPTLPSRLDDERAANPFLRVDSAEVIDWARASGITGSRVDRFAALRRAKDAFRA